MMDAMSRYPYTLAWCAALTMLALILEVLR